MKHSFNIFQENDINYILEFYDMAIEFQTVNSMQQFCQNIKCQKHVKHQFFCILFSFNITKTAKTN